ncbi:hypothetical protein AFLA_005210 [Aspergillus flavus NRRL3357]|nr:hypothetical protein AFLA_005210 [Aspergillus flavus NRRL3357]
MYEWGFKLSNTEELNCLNKGIYSYCYYRFCHARYSSPDHHVKHLLPRGLLLMSATFESRYKPSPSLTATKR